MTTTLRQGLFEGWKRRVQYTRIIRRRRPRENYHEACAIIRGCRTETLEVRHCLSSSFPAVPVEIDANLVAEGFQEAVVANGLTGATAMQFSPDGKLFITEEAGTLEVWDNGVRVQANFFQNSPISTQIVSERGLLGIAFDPNYSTNRYVYVYYTTTAADNHNRVSRFTANGAGNLALAGSEHIIMELDAHSAGNHNGGAMHFGSDGMLYIATGDNANGANAQSLSNRHGKMLRIDVREDDFADAGQNYGIPDSNPTSFDGIAGAPTGFNRAIWAVGLRNPFTFSVQPGTGRIFINDVGQDAWEEINDGAAGRNYGWDTTEGDFSQATFPDFTRPFYTYDQGGSEPNGCAITGGVFYNPANSQFPAEYQGDYFFADHCGGKIWHLDLTTKAVNEFASEIAAPVDLKVDNAGRLYYLARDSGQVVRVSFTSETPQATPPVIGAFGGTVAYRSNADPILVDTDATIADSDSANFEGGLLIARISANAQSTDRVSIRHTGNGAGQIGVSGNVVSYGGTAIGTFKGTTTLIVTFNGNATPAAAQALLRAVTFHSVALTPSTLPRTIAVRVTDGDGGVSNTPTKTVNVTLGVV